MKVEWKRLIVSVGVLGVLALTVPQSVLAMGKGGGNNGGGNNGGGSSSKFEITAGFYICNDTPCPLFDYGSTHSADGITVSFTITNTTSDTIRNFSQNLLGSQVPTNFNITSNNCTSILNGSASCQVGITFLPTGGDPSGSPYGAGSTLAQLSVSGRKAGTLNLLPQGIAASFPVTGLVEVDGTNLDAGASIVARLDNGEALVAFRENGTDGFTRLMVARNIGGSWEAPIQISAQVDRFDLVSNGNEALIAWGEKVTGEKPGDPPITIELNVSHYASGSFDSPVQLDTSSGDFAFKLGAALSSSGKGVVVWEQRFASGAISMSRYDGNSWSAEELVEADTPDNFLSNPVVAMDSAGNFMVAYKRDQPSTGITMEARYFSADEKADGTSSQTMSPNHPRVAMSANGHAIIVYKDVASDSELKSIRHDGSSFQPVEDISLSGISVEHSNVSMDSQGNALVAYERSTPESQKDLYARRSTWNGSAFVLDTAQDIDANSGGDVSVFGTAPMQIRLEDNGDAIVAFSQLDGNGRNSVYATKRLSGSYQAAQELDIVDNNDARSVSLDISSGEATVSFAQSDGMRSNVFSINLTGLTEDVVANGVTHVTEASSFVDFDDPALLLTDWTGPDLAGPPEAALSAAAVPEPSGLVLAVFATLGLCCHRRRRRRAA